MCVIILADRTAGSHHFVCLSVTLFIVAIG